MLKYYTENVLYIAPPQPRFVQNPQRLSQDVYLSEFNHLTPDIFKTQLFRIIPPTTSQPFLHLNPDLLNPDRFKTNLKLRPENVPLTTKTYSIYILYTKPFGYVLLTYLLSYTQYKYIFEPTRSRLEEKEFNARNVETKRAYPADNKVNHPATAPDVRRRNKAYPQPMRSTVSTMRRQTSGDVTLDHIKRACPAARSDNSVDAR
ncbi:hypothetical protein LAZ67_8001000 [Cordylochernes scorpioides]|uniref:Uncharacterized protein n=1 Tax=Cordylochernes scorpioides TaxID=51811 RepID=A0ABY6KUW8_9ARAC|nr:hypothetical protein LAZ67_8001000 [Cordylochernes scorpioides]